MMVRTGSFLVLLWSVCSWQACTSASECDVEGLRCEVICSFPDLTLHCTRCLKRRPMRFGKRSRRDIHQIVEPQYQRMDLASYPSDHEENFPRQRFYTTDDVSSASIQPYRKKSGRMLDVEGTVALKGPSLHQIQVGGYYPRNYAIPWDRKTLLQGSKRKANGLSQDTILSNIDDLLEERMDDILPTRRSPGPTSDRVALHSSRLNNSPHTELFDSQHHQHLLKGFFGGFSQQKKGNHLSDPSDLSTKATLPVVTVNNREESLGFHGKRSLSSTSRNKRSIQKILEDLMRILGLEELPVDPRLYGCQEIILPVSGRSYIVLNNKK